MPVFDPTLTADKAAATLPVDALNASGHKSEGWDGNTYQTKGFIDARRKGKVTHIAPELDIFKEQKKVRIHIFNVGPFRKDIGCGSMGNFVIPACPPDKEYVEMLTPLYALQDETYPKTRNSEPKRLYEEGKKMAIEILGEGRNQDRRNSLRKIGIFIAAGEVPTKKELADAKAELIKTASSEVLFMDNLWDRDRKLAHDVFRYDTYGKYAEVLSLTGKQKGWLAQGTPSDKIACKWCTEPVDPDAPVCHNCKNVVNREKYLELKAEQESLDAAIAPKK